MHLFCSRRYARLYFHHRPVDAHLMYSPQRIIRRCRRKEEIGEYSRGRVLCAKPSGGSEDPRLALLQDLKSRPPSVRYHGALAMRTPPTPPPPPLGPPSPTAATPSQKPMLSPWPKRLSSTQDQPDKKAVTSMTMAAPAIGSSIPERCRLAPFSNPRALKRFSGISRTPINRKVICRVAQGPASKICKGQNRLQMHFKQALGGLLASFVVRLLPLAFSFEPWRVHGVRQWIIPWNFNSCMPVSLPMMRM